MQTYTGSRTDSTRWSGFALRPGDVIVSTPPKCGTTWVMAMVAMLLQGTTDLPAPLSDSSPWLDYAPTPMRDILATYDAQPGRRLIKTHTPVDGLPPLAGVRVVCVLRNPLDAIRSMRRHVLNMARPQHDDPYLQSSEAVIARGIEAEFRTDTVDDVSLALLAHHLRVATAARAARPEAVTVLHYSAIRRDPAGAIAGLAAFLDTPADPPFVARVAAATSLEAMRARAEAFAPLANKAHFKSSAGFFATGEHSGTADLPAPLLAHCDRRLAQLLSPSEARWLTTGQG